MDMSPKDRALARKNLALLRQDCWSVYLETKDVVFRCVPFPITESTSTYFCRDERGYRQIERAGIESCTGAVETKTESTTSAVSGANGIMTALASAHSTTMRYFGDVKNSWFAILMCGPVLGVLASFGYIMFMSVCTRAIVWFGLVSIELILLTFSFACFCKAGVVDVAGFVRKVGDVSARYNLTDFVGDKADQFSAVAAVAENNPRYWETAAFVFLLASVFYVMVICVIRDRISLAIALIAEAGKTISKRMKSLLFYPFVTYIWVLLLLVYFVVITCYIWSADDFTKGDLMNVVNAIKGNLQGTGANGTALAGGFGSMDAVSEMFKDAAGRTMNASKAVMDVVQIDEDCAKRIAEAEKQALISDISGSGSWSSNVSFACTGNETARSFMTGAEDSLTPYFFLIHCFGFLWTNQYIQAVGYITIAGAISLDYWNEPNCSDEEFAKGGPKAEMPPLPAMPLFRALRRTIRYHLGSAAVGGFIIALVVAIRFILLYIYSKTEQLQKTSRAAQAASKACLVCFAVFERCIRYLTRNTYIMVAIEGKPFWTSAYRSFKLLQNNSIRFAAAQGLSSFLLFVAKLGITSFCMLACFLLIEHMPRYGIGGEFEVLSPFLPCFVTFCSALVVAMSFMSIYEIGIDTLLISFCLDEQKFKAGDYDVMVEKGIRPSAKMYAERNKKKQFAKQIRDQVETKEEVQKRLDYAKKKLAKNKKKSEARP